MPFSLFDDHKKPGFHSSILTTYSVDPAFYDANIQYRLRAFGCQNNLLMADGAMLQRSLEEMPEAFVHAGRKYLVVPINGPGCFHPKINIRYGKSKCRLLLGSGNATSAGWGSNRELVTALEWSRDSGDPNQATQLQLIAKVHDWLTAQLPAPADPDLAYKMQLIQSLSPWLADAPRSDGIYSLDDDTQIDCLLSDPTAPSGLADQFIERVEGEVGKLVVISPYWDSRLQALQRLQAAFGSPPLHLFMELTEDANARQSTFPVDALDGGLKPKFHPLTTTGSHRFLHAKLIVATTATHDYVLYGSSNCTVGALGAPGSPGVNHEAAIYRRLPAGTIDQVLSLAYSTEIDVKSIPAPEQLEPTAGPTSFHPGRIERKADRLLWSCPADIDPAGAIFLIAGLRLPVTSDSGARPWVEIGQHRFDSTVIVRVQLADGQISRPVIVTDPDLLMMAAPNPLASGLKKKLDAVLNGDSDLIDLARDIHLIFGDGKETARTQGLDSRGGRTREISTVMGGDYDSPEEFRRALALKADLHASSIPHADNPALQAILQIVLRGIVQVPDSQSVDQDTTENEQAIREGEDQDDAGDEGGVDTLAVEPKSTAKNETIELEAFQRNRDQLVRAIERFEDYVAALAKSQEELDLDFVTKTIFMIYLMFYGCSKRYEIAGRPSDTLIPFSAIGTRQQEYSFLLIAARLVSRIWGPKFQQSLMARVIVDREHGTVPTPIVTLVILSRWVLASILTEARSAKGGRSLVEVLAKQVPPLLRNTIAFGQLEPAQIDAAVDQMAGHLKMDVSRAQAIQLTLREFAQDTDGAPS